METNEKSPYEQRLDRLCAQRLKELDFDMTKDSRGNYKNNITYSFYVGYRRGYLDRNINKEEQDEYL